MVQKRGGGEPRITQKIRRRGWPSGSFDSHKTEAVSTHCSGQMRKSVCNAYFSGNTKTKGTFRGDAGAVSSESRSGGLRRPRKNTNLRFPTRSENRLLWFF